MFRVSFLFKRPAGRSHGPNWRAAELARSARHGRAGRRRPRALYTAGRIPNRKSAHRRRLPEGTPSPRWPHDQSRANHRQPRLAPIPPGRHPAYVRSRAVSCDGGGIGYRVDGGRPGHGRLRIAGTVTPACLQSQNWAGGLQLAAVRLRRYTRRYPFRRTRLQPRRRQPRPSTRPAARSAIGRGAADRAGHHNSVVIVDDLTKLAARQRAPDYGTSSSNPSYSTKSS